MNKTKPPDYVITRVDEIWYILKNYDIDQKVLRKILHKLYDYINKA